MQRDIINSIAQYFQSEQWNELESRVERDSVNTLHAHIFVDTNIHPESLCDLLRVYYEARGMKIDRSIDFQPSNVGHHMLHGIYPAGTFHYDMAWRYSPDVAIAPMPHELVKEKQNLQIWDKQDIAEFFDRYDFVTDADKAKPALDAFFASETWRRTAELVRDRSIAHFHTNVEMSIHPDLLQAAALEQIQREGWPVEKSLHCIFSPRAGWTTGKVVLMLKEPEVAFDIAWSFNPDTLIRPSEVYFMIEDEKEFDIRKKEPIDYYVGDREFVRLSDQDLEQIKQALAA